MIDLQTSSHYVLVCKYVTCKIELVECTKMNEEIHFGFKSLTHVFDKAFIELESDHLKCITFNANLDYVLSLLETYPSLESISIIANSEHVVHSGHHTEKISNLIRNNILNLYWASENLAIIPTFGNYECVY